VYFGAKNERVVSIRRFHSTRRATGMTVEGNYAHPVEVREGKIGR
jgi:ketosteroid isomerase-like protein